MRAYFKNDLFNYASQQQKMKERKEKKPKQPKIKIEKSESEQEPIEIAEQDVQKMFKIDFVQNKKNEWDEDQELRKIIQQSSRKIGGGEKKQKKNYFYTPKCTLKPLAPKQSEKKQLTQIQKENQARKHRIEMWRMREQLKKNIKFQNNEGKEGQNNDDSKAIKEHKSDQKNEKDKEESDSSVDKKKPATTGKKKKIKKEGNYVQINMKKKYKDRFVGGLSRNLRMFNKNGRIKGKYRKNAEHEFSEGQAFNKFATSLSKALFFMIDLDAQSEIEEQKLSYTVPAEINKENLTKLIQDLFGFQYFREGQYQTIENIINGKSTLFVSQTASGKSLTYLLSSICLKGLSIVVSPLVSLMLDQLEHLPSDLPAACISSLLDREDRQKVIKMVKDGKIQLLFITPESLLSDFLFHASSFPPINFLCIDEAHSLSELEHSFRNSYLSLVEIVLKYFKYTQGKPVILCLTATANLETMSSIMKKLDIHEKIRSKSIINKNIFITVSREELGSKYEALLKYLNVEQIAKCRGIMIYCRTKKIMFEVFNYLRNSGMGCCIFHSGLTQKEKIQTMENFRRGLIKRIISTVALGMGLDFDNLDCVIHINMTKSVENYIQETGRAGRREKRAYCHLFLDPYDYFTQRNYFLADELEVSSFEKLISFMKKGQRTLNNKKSTAKAEKQLKRLSIQTQKKQQSDEQEAVQLFEENDRANLLSYGKVLTLTEMCNLKQEAILKIFLKIEELLGEDTFKVHPVSAQTIKISFFKNKQEKVVKQCEYFQRVVKDCKKIKGSCYIHLINKANQFQITPIQLLSKLYQISNEHMLKIEMINDVFVWQHKKSKFETLQQLSKKQILNQIIQQFNSVQKTSLVKLNIFYSLCFNYSRKNISHIINHNQIIKEDAPLPSNPITQAFNKYFTNEAHSYYARLTTEQSQQEISYLPIEQISSKDKDDIYQNVVLFFKHIISSSSEKELSRILKPYRDGKVITRVFLGVNDGSSSWKVYGQLSYWMKFKEKDYQELLQVVRSSILKFIEVESIKFMNIK